MASYMISPPEGTLDDEFPGMDGMCLTCGALADQACEQGCGKVFEVIQ